MTARILLDGSNLIQVLDAGFGETPVPDDALLQPGQVLEAFSAEPPHTIVKFTTLAVVPVGVPVEYAIADQADPKQPRPLMIAHERRKRKETVYVLLREGETEPEIFPHSVLTKGQQRADDMKARGELPTEADAAPTPPHPSNGGVA